MQFASTFHHSPPHLNPQHTSNPPHTHTHCGGATAVALLCQFYLTAPLQHLYTHQHRVNHISALLFNLLEWLLRINSCSNLRETKTHTNTYILHLHFQSHNKAHKPSSNQIMEKMRKQWGSVTLQKTNINNRMVSCRKL